LFRLRKNKVSVKKIAKFLKTNYSGVDFEITTISSLNNIKNNSILFYSDLTNVKFKVRDNIKYDLKKLEKFDNVVLIAEDKIRKKINTPILTSLHPRYDFYRVAMEFFSNDEFKPGVHKTAIVEKNSVIGRHVYIGPHCYIGNDVKIGNNTKIFHNTCIYGKTEIGSNTIIKSNTTIGSEGFGFSYTGKELSHFPHLGSIVIGNNVWIGSNCTVEKSQIDQTVIEDHVKIDDLVHIGHNSIIKKFTQITAGCIVAGRVQLGQGCWLSSNSVIDNGCELGDNCMVGTSSLVRSNFPKNSIVIGSPAKFLRKNT